jgi:hypothetical protein
VPPSNESFREFQNPNIRISVQFKNKIKNNNYEFIVTVTPEDPSAKSDQFKQYKVKRNIYEF